MKAFLFAVLCLGVVSARAITLNVDFGQQNYGYDVLLVSSDHSLGTFEVNGFIVGGETNAVHLNGLLNPIPSIFNYGINTTAFITQSGETIAGASFTLTQPTGLPPENAPRLPEGGNMAALLALGVGVMALAHWRVQTSKYKSNAGC